MGNVGSTLRLFSRKDETASQIDDLSNVLQANVSFLPKDESIVIVLQTIVRQIRVSIRIQSQRLGSLPNIKNKNKENTLK